MAKEPKKLVDLPPKPIHETVDFSNTLPDRFERRERYSDLYEGWPEDIEDELDRRDAFGPIFGFDDI